MGSILLFKFESYKRILYIYLKLKIGYGKSNKEL